jgi:preprotein translocase subunit SecA
VAIGSASLRRKIQRVLGNTVERDLEPYLEHVDAINRLEPALESASDDDLENRAHALRDRALGDAGLDALLVEVFAVAREVSRRCLGLRPFDEQLIAGIAMHRRKIAEMQTGEGKTLAAVAPATLHALAGHGVHVLTFNDYLARRDAAWMGPIYEFLGLRVGCIQEGMTPAERQRAYSCDITYLTAKEAGFDFLRDFLCLEPEQLVRRNAGFVLVDEADSILIDEARIPLVIAGGVDEQITLAVQAAAVARRLRAGVDFDTDEYDHNIFLTGAGSTRVEEMLGCDNLYSEASLEALAAIRNALHAENLLHRDVDYIVRHGRIELVDDFTGRVADKRQWPDGLQAAIEAKERLDLQDEGMILGSITMQHFLQTYPRLCGMTATASPAAKELETFYELGVVVIPTHCPCIRADHGDRIYTDRGSKRRALVSEIGSVHATGRPILVGTASVAESEELAAELRETGVHCRVLNAKNDELEADVIASAGALGAVTISTNMAGRGTDIRLGGADESKRDEVVALGGLYVIGTNRHESLRVDRQLRGRAGRQGDPGSSRFFISLEDPLIERYGVKNLITVKYLPESSEGPVDNAVLRREIARSQRIIEGENFDVRRRLWQFSQPIEWQRNQLQKWRQEILLDGNRLDVLADRCPDKYEKALSDLGGEKLAEIEKRLALLIIDRCWSDHLATVNRIRDGIHVVKFAGKDSVGEFFRETGQAFQGLRESIDREIVETFTRIEITPDGVDWEKEGLQGPSATWTYLVSDDPFGANAMLGIANRTGIAAIAVLFHMPLMLAWGLYLHWKRRKKKAELAERDGGDPASPD